MTAWRRIDSGLAEAGAQMALGWALFEGLQTDTSPPTFRFFQCRPALLIGRHQPAPGGADLPVVRRPSGGGTVYVDPGQLCWEWIGNTASTDPDSIAQALAAGLGQMGVAARYRPGFGLETERGKLGGAAGIGEGSFGWLQGTLFISEASALEAARQIRAPLPLASLEGLAGNLPPIDAVRAAMIKGLADAGFRLVAGVLAESEEQAAKEWQARLARPDFVDRGEIDGD